MRLNAELKRNLWLEVSWQRLIAIPAILAGLYYLIFVNAGNSKALLLFASFWVFLVAVGLWGAHQAENSLAGEVQAGTWPLQRLTSISPWSMTWGKLFGSTLVSWYIGLISLLVFTGTLIIFPAHELFPQTSDQWNLLSEGTAVAILSLIGVVLLIQLTGLLNGFTSFQDRRMKPGSRLGSSLILSLILIAYFSSLSLADPQFSKPVLWYGQEFSKTLFFLFFLCVLVAWTLTAAYMQMRKEFQVDNPPWAWLGFLIFINVYLIGFAETLMFSSLDLWDGGWLAPGGAATIFITYLMLFWERANGVELHRLFHLILQRRWRDASCVVPRWSMSAVLACGIGGTLLAIDWIDATKSLKEQIMHFSVVGAMLCLMMRDIALFLFLCFSDKPQRATTTTLLILLVFYVQIPWMLNLAGLESLWPLFLPTGDPSILVAILPAFLQALGMWFFTVMRWRKKFSSQTIG